MAAVNLIGSYNYALVPLSLMIGIFASDAALDLAVRITAVSGWLKRTTVTTRLTIGECRKSKVATPCWTSNPYSICRFFG